MIDSFYPLTVCLFSPNHVGKPRSAISDPYPPNQTSPFSDYAVVLWAVHRLGGVIT